MNPVKTIISNTQLCKFEVPLKRFFVKFGYKDRAHAQVRLEDDGKVFLSHSPEAAKPGERTIEITTVDFDLFQRKFREFVLHLQAINRLGAEDAMKMPSERINKIRTIVSKLIDECSCGDGRNLPECERCVKLRLMIEESQKLEAWWHRSR